MILRRKENIISYYSGRLGEGNILQGTFSDIGYLLQDSGLENSMDGIVHGGRKELDMTERLSLED